MASYIVKEVDGTSKFTLEDGSGAVLLETSTGGGGGGGGSAVTPNTFAAQLALLDLILE